MDIRVSDRPADAAAAFIARLLRDAVAERSVASLAVSGGSTAPPMFDAMLDAGISGGVPWAEMTVWQVDERIAPDGDADRNAGQLDPIPAQVELMEVTDADPVAAARRYGAAIADPLDVVHLGVGGDGHTASWPPEPHVDASTALHSTERAFVVGEFNGRERMTLGADVVNAARHRVVLATGDDKAGPIRRWLADGVSHARVDTTLPIAVIEPANTVVFLDRAASSGLSDMSPGR